MVGVVVLVLLLDSDEPHAAKATAANATARPIEMLRIVFMYRSLQNCVAKVKESSNKCYKGIMSIG